MPDETPDTEMVPKAEMLRRLKAKQGKIEELTQQLDDMKVFADSQPDPQKLDELQAKYEALQADYDGYKQQQETTATLYQAGITDPDVQDLVRYRHGKLGADAPALADWLKDGASADPLLAPHIRREEPASEAAEQPQQPAAAPVPAPQPHRTGNPAPKPGSGLTLETLGQLSRQERIERKDEIWKLLGRG